MHNFARKVSTRKPEAHQREHEESAEEDIRSISPVTVDTHQVTDVDSQTTVGCFSRRNANTTLPATIVKKMTNAVLSETLKEGDDAERT